MTTPDTLAAAADTSTDTRAGLLARCTAPLVLAGVGLAAVVLVAVVDPNQPGHFPLCPFRALTGLDCPFCGGLRSVHDLAHGHLVAAADQNALVVLAVPVALLGWLRWTAGSVRARPLPPAPRWVLPVTLAALLVFSVVRNLPGVPFLHSGLG